MCERQNGELVGGVAVVVKATSLVVHIDASNTKLLFLLYMFQIIVKFTQYASQHLCTRLWYRLCLIKFVHIMLYKVYTLCFITLGTIY